MGENNDINKFRVWSTKEKSYGGFFHDSASINEDGKLSVHYWCKGEYTTDILGDGFEEGDYIIERCTGLRDKNGKLIYAGDIVEVVYFDREGSDYTMQGCIIITEFGVMLDYVKGEHFKAYTGGSENVYLCEWLRDFVDDPEAQIEIIGNIHEQEVKP